MIPVCVNNVDDFLHTAPQVTQNKILKQINQNMLQFWAHVLF